MPKKSSGFNFKNARVIAAKRTLSIPELTNTIRAMRSAEKNLAQLQEAYAEERAFMQRFNGRPIPRKAFLELLAKSLEKSAEAEKTMEALGNATKDPRYHRNTKVGKALRKQLALMRQIKDKTAKQRLKINTQD